MVALWNRADDYIFIP